MERKQFRKQFDSLLTTHLEKKIATIEPYIFSDDLEKIYSFLIPYSQGGKRIRPYLVYLLYHIGGGKNTELALQAGIVNELIHLFALVHDDINDKGTTRHSLPTYHKYAEQILGDEYQGINMGILIGDALMSRAYEHLHTLSIPHDTKQHYFTMLNTTMYGQIQDVYLSHTKQLHDKEIILTKDKAKSGDYSFMRPMVIGATLADVTDIQPIKKLGSALGIAFQMRDDLLDIIDGHGNKTAFSDHQEGNQTFLLAHARSLANDEEKTYLMETRGKPCNETIQKKLLAIYDRTGTIDRAHDEINNRLIACTKELATRKNNRLYDQTYIPYLQTIIDFLLITPA